VNAFKNFEQTFLNKMDIDIELKNKEKKPFLYHRKKNIRKISPFKLEIEDKYKFRKKIKKIKK